MSEKVKLIDECTTNVTNIQLSEDTKALLLCRARLSDIHANVANVVENQYGKDYERIFNGFDEALLKLDSELVKIISMFIEVTSLQSDYKEM